MGTSKAAEGEGLGKLFGEAHHEGMVISNHVQDFGSSSILALHEHYTDESKTKIILCRRAQQTRLKSFAKSKKCTKTIILFHEKEYPNVKNVKCHRQSRHNQNCGCYSKSSSHQAKLNLTQCLFNARCEKVCNHSRAVPFQE